MASNHLPLTEQVLVRLGRPRILWMLAWALVPLLRPVALTLSHAIQGDQAQPHTALDLLVPQAVQAYAVLLTLWGVHRLSEGIRQVEADLARHASGRIGRGRVRLDGRAGPVILTAAVAIGETAIQVMHHGPIVAAVDAPLLVLNVLPLATFVWTFVSLLAAMDRLGRSHLRLDPFPQDRTLGLGGVGAIAFTGFWIAVAAAVPVTLMSGREVGTFLLGGAVVAVSLVGLVLAMLGIHRQMTAAKARYRELTRSTFESAYAPFRANPTLDVLADQANVIRAAQALDERAEHVYEWPIDERTAARMAIVTTGVVTGLIVRAVFVALGY